jgi:hypothetical protein
VTKTITTTNTTDHTGVINISGDLIASLFQNDKLNFGLDVNGDLFLTRATRDVNQVRWHCPA